MKLENKNIFITGAGKGIGLAITEKCLDGTSHVFALTRSKTDLKKYKNKKNLSIFYGDVRDKKIINKIFLYSKKIQKPINALVNNAGERQRIKFNSITEKQIRHIFDINFFLSGRISHLSTFITCTSKPIFINLDIISLYLIRLV